MVKRIHCGVYCTDRGDIYTEGASTRRGHTHGGTITPRDIHTEGRHVHAEDLYLNEKTYGGDIHGEIYIWWSVHRVECSQSSVYTVET